MDSMDIMDVMDIVDIMDFMDIMEIIDIMNIMNITTQIAMAGAVLALVHIDIDMICFILIFYVAGAESSISKPSLKQYTYTFQFIVLTAQFKLKVLINK